MSKMYASITADAYTTDEGKQVFEVYKTGGSNSCGIHNRLEKLCEVFEK